MRHQAAFYGRIVVGIRPFVHTHLPALQIHTGRQTIRDRLALAVPVYRDRGLVTVLHGPDDVLGAERRIAAEEHARAG